jgi:16S rRNA (cytosine967-C5)-methyltransferase
MKLHPLLVKAVEQALNDIFNNGKYADKVLEKLLKSNSKWGSRDRSFIAETTYDCVRWWRLYTHLCEKSGLRESWTNIIGICLTLKNGVVPEYSDFAHLDFLKLQAKHKAVSERKIKESIPDWLDKLCENEIGADVWSTEMTALNRPAEVILRVNTLKINVLDLQKKLNELGWETSSTPLSKNALILKKRGSIFKTEPFQNGFFEVQDAGSQEISPFLQVESGMRVIDACAGAGGKSLHLATLMNNKGTLISMDTEGWKLEELKKRSKRNGIHIIETRTIDSTKVIKRLHDSADRLLLDVPCSGLGVLRRNPDAKWKLKPEFLAQIRTTQQQILQEYSKMIKIGGKMVYATCSILPSENGQQVKTFLENNPNFKWVDEKIISPAAGNSDGFYMALLERV